MALKKNSSQGRVNVSMAAIAAITANAAMECYGVVGLASKSIVRDNIAELLRKENYSQGVFARQRKFGIEIDMYIIVSYGVRITEVVSEVQKKVKYVLEKTLNMKFNYINVYVQNVKNI